MRPVWDNKLKYKLFVSLLQNQCGYTLVILLSKHNKEFPIKIWIR